MATHQKFSASSAHRWIACPGSIAAAEGCPPQALNDFADEGTAAHLVLEYCLRFDCGPGDAAVKINGKDYEVDDEMREGVQLALDTVRAIPGQPIIEFGFLLEDDLGGTVDCGVYDAKSKTIYVYDFKYGRRAVNPVGNPQLAIYGKGILKMFPEAESIVLGIIQPRVTPSVSIWTISADDFGAWFGSHVLAGYYRAKEPNAPRHAGNHCRYCPALDSLRCPESHKAITAATCSDFDIDVSKPIKLPLMDTLTNDQVARLIDFSDLISDYCKGVKQLAHDRLMAGQKIPGWKVVQKRSNRAWIDPQRTIDTLGVVLGRKIFTEPEVLSPAQMEKALKAAGKDVKLVDALTQKPDAGLSIAPESDKRKEVVPQLGSDFAAGAASDLV